MAAFSRPADALGGALVDFTQSGAFPDEDVVSLQLQNSQLAVALETLSAGREALENEIRTISKESAPDVDSWIRNAEQLEDEIAKSRSLADKVARQGALFEEDNRSPEAAQSHVDFLLKEILYSTQVADALQSLKIANEHLNDSQRVGSDGDLMRALEGLNQAQTLTSQLPSSGASHATAILAQRSQQIKDSFSQVLDDIWQAFIDVSSDRRAITINIAATYSGMTMQDMVTIMNAFGRLEEKTTKFQGQIEKTILEPRLDLDSNILPSIRTMNDTLSTSAGGQDASVQSLLDDLECIVNFFFEKLPAELALSVTARIMPKTIDKVIGIWFDSAIPASLDEIPLFINMLNLAHKFADTLSVNNCHGSDQIRHWASNAPKIWLAKRREASLDSARKQLSLVFGPPKKVERAETQKISKNESRHIAQNAQAEGAGDDWNDGWSDDETSDDKNTPVDERKAPQQSADDGFDAWDTEESDQMDERSKDEDDGAADAWGWGDEDPADSILPQREGSKPATGIGNGISKPESVREVTLTETYTISAFPERIMNVIRKIVEDATYLTKPESAGNPIAIASGGLFGVSTLVLAIFRSMSPNFYASQSGGNMYLYNDAMWLAENLRKLTLKSKASEDIPERAKGRINFDTDIKFLEGFGRRGYGTEMNTQKTILNDLLGGSQNFLYQEGQRLDESDMAIDCVVARIRQISIEWRDILSKSAWAQAIGSLISTIVDKIIVDVEDLNSLGADEAYRVASMIAKVLVLDDLFMPEIAAEASPVDTQPIPLTSQYVPNWLKLHFLSEVLQSDLNDVRYLWFESDLSRYFTAQEVIDLIKLSFEINQRTREAVNAIREKPHPRADD